MSIAKRPSVVRILTAAGCIAWLWPCAAAAGDSSGVQLKAGATLETLTVGSTIYSKVVVKSVSARSVMITHSGGMASLRLRDLSPELQAGFGYNAAAESVSDQALKKAGEERQAKMAADAKAMRASGAAKPAGQSRFDRVLQEFGQAAKLEPEVDLRPRFRELELYAKNQGRRPSCAVFAVVSALEFMNGDVSGHAEKLSEEYLVWATYKSIQRTAPSQAALAASDDEDADAGFALTEVVTALRSYGIPLQSAMPNTFGLLTAKIPDPPPEIIADARQRAQVAVHLVPGRDTATQLNNIAHALNAGLPVAIGAAWPRFYKMKAALLNTQDPIPGSGHAVTLVGYTSKSGRLEDAVFIFKNSWGASWGAGGYGYATYAYLVKNLQSAVLLEVRQKS